MKKLSYKHTVPGALGEWNTSKVFTHAVVGYVNWPEYRKQHVWIAESLARERGVDVQEVIREANAYVDQKLAEEGERTLTVVRWAASEERAHQVMRQGDSSVNTNLRVSVYTDLRVVPVVREPLRSASVNKIEVAKVKRPPRHWNDTKLTLGNAQQDMIAEGDIVRSYDFPGSRDDCYLEGVVEKREIDRLLIHVTSEVWQREQMQVSRFKVWSPLGVSSPSGAPCVFLIEKRKVRS